MLFMPERIQKLVREKLAEIDTYEGLGPQDLQRLWRTYLWEHRYSLYWALAAAAGTGLIQMCFPLTGKFLADYVLEVGRGDIPEAEIPEHLRRTGVYFGILIGLWSLQLGCRFSQAWLALRAVQELTYRLREDLHRKLQSLHLHYFERTPTGKILARVLDDVNVIRQTVAQRMVLFVTSVSQLLIGLGVLFYLSWELALILALTLPLYAFTFLRLRPLIRDSHIALRRINSSMYARASERVSGVQVVTAFAKERYELRQFANQVFDFVRLGNMVVTYNHLLTLCAGLISGVTTALVLYLGALAVRNGDLSIGSVMAFWSATASVFLPVNQLSTLATEFQGVLVVLRRVFLLLDEKVELDSGQIHLTGMRGKIDFDHVSFCYPGQNEPAIDQLDLHIGHGERIAIMGPSGAGKSTLFYLLLRFYDPQDGVIRVGGVEVPSADLGSLRRHVVMVQQEPAIFSGTIAENVLYGRLGAKPSQIMAACEKAELHEFIMSLPVKYETEVGENGVTLSGGQRQRLALATALLTDPEVLLLDDTTSALDAATEARIRSTLNNVLKGRTSLIITQRIATARDCDRIVVLDRGKLVQLGNHAQLSQQDGFYRRVCEQQGVDV